MHTTHKPPVRAHIDAILKRYTDENWTLQELADEYGVSRQRISQLLIESGHAPATRRAGKQAHQSDWKARRAESLEQRARLRDAACDRFAALARELCVSPQTLGQYAARAGVYARRTAPRGHQALPPRSSSEGNAVARRAATAAAPWAPRHIANLASRRT